MDYSRERLTGLPGNLWIICISETPDCAPKEMHFCPPDGPQPAYIDRLEISVLTYKVPPSQVALSVPPGAKKAVVESTG